MLLLMFMYVSNKMPNENYHGLDSVLQILFVLDELQCLIKLLLVYLKLTQNT